MNKRTEAGTGWEMDLKRAAWERVADGHNLLESRRVERKHPGLRVHPGVPGPGWGSGRPRTACPWPLSPPLPLPSGPTHLDLLVQQLQGQVLKRDTIPDVKPWLAEEAGDGSGIPGLAPRVDVLEGLEIVVQGMTHHHLALQELEDL